MFTMFIMYVMYTGKMGKMGKIVQVCWLYSPGWLCWHMLVVGMLVVGVVTNGEPGSFETIVGPDGT